MSPRYALISVTDKSQLDVFAKELIKLGWQLLSTGGSAQYLRDHGISVIEISEWTGSPEIMDGRVKTLHPKVHAGILCDRNNPNHFNDLEQIGAQPIDMVVVNLYDFAGKGLGLDLHKAIEYIDIGGPTMLRAAAKNYQHCLSVIDPSDYPLVIEHLKNPKPDFAVKLAQKVFAKISSYDQQIQTYFSSTLAEDKQTPFPEKLHKSIQKVMDLRYGENPHQKAAFYKDSDSTLAGLHHSKILQGKELSYNNILDLNSAVAIARDLYPLNSCVIVKHNNPCGVSVSEQVNSLSLFQKAFACDPTSAFGGIISLSCKVSVELAEFITEHIFIECLIAPAFDPEALRTFSKKPNIRLLQSDLAITPATEQVVWTQVIGGILVQQADKALSQPNEWRCVTKLSPTPTQLQDLKVAEIVAKHVKSNALVFVKNQSTVAIGAGQMSRIDSARLALQKNQLAREQAKLVASVGTLKEAVMASDAFFPFPDVVELVAAQGVKAIVQPGGSIKDDASTAACNQYSIAMLHSGIRHFRH